MIIKLVNLLSLLVVPCGSWDSSCSPSEIWIYPMACSLNFWNVRRESVLIGPWEILKNDIHWNFNFRNYQTQVPTSAGVLVNSLWYFTNLKWLCHPRTITISKKEFNTFRTEIRILIHFRIRYNSSISKSHDRSGFRTDSNLADTFSWLQT